MVVGLASNEMAFPDLVGHSKALLETGEELRLNIFTLAKSNSRSGNRITAQRWAVIFRALGHRVSISSLPEMDCEILVAIHAEKTAELVLQFRRQQANAKLIVVLSGTDIYGRAMFSKRALDSLNAANAIVTLEQQAMNKLTKKLRAKTTVISQSALPGKGSNQPLKSCFEVTVSGHLRTEKDPFLIAQAVQMLPQNSRICVTHMGKAMSAKMRNKAVKLSASEPRYAWRGEKAHWRARSIVARSRLMVNTSLLESSANSIVEAVVAQTPVIATRVPGNVGVFGAKYPGLFPIKDAVTLSKLLRRAESDVEFYNRLRNDCRQIAIRFTPEKEKLSWQKLLSQLS